MNNNVLKNKKNTKMISIFIVIVSFLFLLIVTKNIYFDMQISSDELATVNSELSKKNEELAKLNSVKTALTSSGELANSLNKFTGEFSEQLLLEYFYTYSYRPNSGVIINNISLDKGYKNEYGFIEGSINLSLTMRDESSMQAFINFLNSPTSKYNFILSSFSYPFGLVTKNFQVNIPLKVLYY